MGNNEGAVRAERGGRMVDEGIGEKKGKKGEGRMKV